MTDSVFPEDKCFSGFDAYKRALKFPASITPSSPRPPVLTCPFQGLR